VLVGWYLQIRVFGVAPRASRLKAIENKNSRLKRPHPEYENCPQARHLYRENIYYHCMANESPSLTKLFKGKPHLEQLLKKRRNPKT